VDSEASYHLLDTFVGEARDQLERWEAICLKLEHGFDFAVCDELFRVVHSLKGSSQTLGLMDFGVFVHRIEDAMGPLKYCDKAVNDELLSWLLEAQKILTDWIDQIANDLQYVADTESFLLRAPDVDAIGVKACIGSAESAETPPAAFGIFADDEVDVPPESCPSKPGQTPPCRGKDSCRNTESPRKHSETIRISADKLSNLLQLIGELSTQQSIVSHASTTANLESDAAQKAISLCQKIVKDVQAEALSLRMQTLESLFQRLERAARDVAHGLGKPLQINIEGEHVELDKSVLEKILEPMVHIVRNAVDHGIETPAEREARGKPAQASVTLQGLQEADGVKIIVSDDGQGLNKDQIKQQAVARGLLAPDAAVNDSQLYQIVMKPGFSTKGRVTEISGRGVGMDVVKSTVETLRGQIEITSREGEGTSIMISLPTALSIIDALVVKCDDLPYAIPLHEVSEIIDLNNYDVEASSDQDRMIWLRGEIVPIESLSAYMGVTTTAAGSSLSEAAKHRARYAPVLVTRAQSGPIAFAVDEIVRQQSVVVRELEGKYKKLRGFSGATILGDGQPGFILNLSVFAAEYFNNSAMGMVG
jgi:two-component system chemotaxis sensor kinase CheA